ncbi:MAG TPA: hypothetical protein VMT88_12520, partial [Actinomycetes bacterium]|nr:hypothetical protein [Actinomycetes bacterium]
MNETQLRELLQRDAADISTGPPPSLDAFRDQPSSQTPNRHWMSGWPVLAAAASVAAIIVLVFAVLPDHSSGGDDGNNLIGGQPDTDSTMRPDLMVPQPHTALPGEYVSLQFPEETLRGLAFSLQAAVGDTWVPVDYLRPATWETSGPHFVAGPFKVPPSWEANGTDETGDPFAVEDIAVGGDGPDVVMIPDTAVAGDYRICTANAKENFCTPIQVAESAGLVGIGQEHFQCDDALTTDGPLRPVAPADITQILVCPVSTGDTLPIVIHQAQSVTVDASDPQFRQLVAALSLP